MAYIYNLTDTWNAAGTTFSSIKMVVTNTASAAGSALLDLSVTGATSGSFVVDKNANLTLSGKINKYTFTAPATGATIALADGSTLTTVGAYALTLTTTGITSLTLPTSGTLTTTSNNLSVFASTTSSQLAGVISDETGSGALVFATSPTLVTPVLGTPTSGTLTNCTGYTVGNISGLGTGVATFLATPSSLNLKTAVTDETGSGSLVFATSPTLVTPILGTPTSGTLTNCTGLPVGGISATGTPSASTYLRGDGSWSTVSGGSGTVTSVAQSFTGGLISVSGSPITTSGTLALTVAGTSGGIPYFSSASTWASSGTLAANALVIGGGAGAAPSTITTGTGVVTALGVNTGSSGAFVVNGGALGTPTNGTLTNCTGYTVGNISGLGSGVATFLATPSSANLASAVTDETGSGPLVFATSPTFTSAITLGTASTTQGSLVLANTSANSVTLKSNNSTSAAYTLTLPTTAGTNGYFLQTDGLGNLAWAAGGGGGGGSVAGSDTQVQFNDGGAFGASAAFTFAKASYTLTLGVQQTSQGAIVLANTAAGAYSTTLKASNSASAAWTLTLPTTAGSNGQVLTTDGTGVASWTTVSGGSLTVGSSSISGGTSGRILYDNAGTLGEKAVTGTGDVVLATSPTLITPALGTPSSGTLTNCTGLPVGGISATGTPSGSTYLRGDGSWSSISSMVYPSAGIAVSTGSAWGTSLTAPSGAIVGTTDSQTLTNKRIDPRTSTTASASSLTPDISAYDQYSFTALAAGLTINAPTGTPVQGNKLVIRITDNGTTRTLTWNAIFRAIGVTLPTSTTANKTVYVGLIYNSDATKWDAIAVAQEA